jgi:hypothetical protein
VRDLNGINVGLTAEGAGGYSWGLPEVISVEKSWNPSSRWYRAFVLNGNGPGTSSLLSYSALREIDSQLRRSTPAYNGFEGLCGNLGLPVQRGNLTPSFQVLGELPAQVRSVTWNGFKSALRISIECFGAPDLMVESFPGHEFKRFPAGGIGKPTPAR